MYSETKKTDFQCPSADIETISKTLIASDDLCKLLYFTDGKPLAHELTDEIRASLFDDNYVSIIPWTNADTKEKSNIVISFDNFMPTITNSLFMDSTLIFDIMCPRSIWKIKDRQNKTVLRPYEIAHLVHKLVDGKRFSGIGTAVFSNAQSIIIPANEYVGGLSLRYTLTNDA